MGCAFVRPVVNQHGRFYDSGLEEHCDHVFQECMMSANICLELLSNCNELERLGTGSVYFSEFVGTPVNFEASQEFPYRWHKRRGPRLLESRVDLD